MSPGADGPAAVIPPYALATPQLAAALAVAQGAFKSIHKTKEVTVRPREGAPYKFTYATMSDVMEAIQEALSANGLSISHAVRSRMLYSTLLHTSGEERVSEFDLGAVDKARMQAMGSALTYGQRYNVRLLLNLTSDDDDDGQQGAEAQQAPPARMALARERTLSDPQKQALAKENLTVGTKMSAGAQAQDSVDTAARRKAEETIASFADMDLEALRLWWRDSSDLRESWEAMFPQLHQKVLDALDNRRDTLKVHNG